jgi:hypothetical protein
LGSERFLRPSGAEYFSAIYFPTARAVGWILPSFRSHGSRGGADKVPAIVLEKIAGFRLAESYAAAILFLEQIIFNLSNLL